jgi:lipoprotein-releasing system permease protein
LGFSRFISQRLLRSNGESRQLSTPIVRIAVGGIALGLTVMILAVAIVTGFQEEIRGKVIGFGSHIQIIKYDSNKSLEATPIARNQPFVQQVKEIPGVESIQPVGRKPGIIKSGDAIEGVLFKGVDRNDPLKFFGQHLVSGRLPQFKGAEKSNEILVSAQLASQLKLAADSNLIMYFVQDPPKARKFKVSGIYNTGLGDNDFDKIYVIGDLRVIQQLNNWDSTLVGGFEITLTDYSQLKAINEQVYQTIPNDLTSNDVEEVYPQIFGWLGLMDTNVYIIIVLMLSVSVINMITSLLIMILERTRMIGILKALGAGNRAVSLIFLRQAGGLTLRGMVIGNMIGIGLCLIQHYTGLISLNQETYYLSSVPINLEWWHLVVLNIGTFAVCMLCMLLPVLVIARFSPAKTIRFA